MSIRVDLEELADRIAELGTGPFLVTVGEDGPHVVSVAVVLDGGRFATAAGRRTVANLEARPSATLLWPAPEGSDYSLLVDVTGPPDALEPTSAVLHRVATADAGLPGCVRLDDA